VKKVDVDLLQYYVKEFHEYKTSVERVDRVFAYYNRWWAKKAGFGNGSLDVILPVNSVCISSSRQKNFSHFGY
jgi:hypothetical protein